MTWPARPPSRSTSSTAAGRSRSIRWTRSAASRSTRTRATCCSATACRVAYGGGWPFLRRLPHRHQRLPRLPRRRIGAGLRAGPARLPRRVRRGALRRRALPVRRRQRRGPALRRVLVLLAPGLPSGRRAAHRQARRTRVPAAAPDARALARRCPRCASSPAPTSRWISSRSRRSRRSSPADLALAATRWIAQAHAGDRRAAQARRSPARRGRRSASPTTRDGRRRSARRSARSRCCSAQVDDLAAWSDADKAACVALMRAKGADDDAPFFRCAGGASPGCPPHCWPSPARGAREAPRERRARGAATRRTGDATARGGARTPSSPSRPACRPARARTRCPGATRRAPRPRVPPRASALP